MGRFLIGAEFTWIYGKTFGSMQNLDAELEAKTVAAAPTVASTPDPAAQAREAEHAKGANGHHERDAHR